jgi:hypothetical protein
MSSGTMRIAVLSDKLHLAMTEHQLLAYFYRYTGVTVLSAVGKLPPQHLVRSTGTAMSTTGSHGVRVRPNGHPRSLPAPSARWATHHPRLRGRANVSLQDKARDFAGPRRSGARCLC